MVSRISDEAWKEAVLRIAAGQSTETAEAKRLKVHKSTVSRKVAELGPKLKGATDATGATNATKPTAEGKTPLEIAREAAKGAAGPEVLKALATAQLEDARFCVETLQGYKSAGVYLVAQFSGVPSTDQTLPGVAKLSEMAKGVIAQNAHWLAPALRAQSSELVLYCVLGIEAFLAYMVIRGLSVKYAPPDDPLSPEAGEGARPTTGASPPVTPDGSQN